MIVRTAVRSGLAFILCGLLAACSNMGLNQADDQAARRVYAQIHDGDVAALRAWSGPEMTGPEAPAQLQAIRAAMPPGRPKSIKTTGWKYNIATGTGNTLETSHDYDYGDRKVTVQTVLRRTGTAGPWRAAGLHLNVKPTAPAPPAAQPAAKTGRVDS